MEEVRKGRGLVLCVIGIMIMVSLITLINYWIVIGFGDIVTQIIRFSLTIVLCYFLYKGHKWAKVTIIILASLAFLMAIFGGDLHILLIIMAIAYAYCSIILLASKNIKSFMEYQKNRSYKTEFLNKNFEK